MLVRTLRERTVAPIAVVSRFFEFPLAVKIRTQRRPLPLFRNQSVLSTGFSRKITLKFFIEITKRNRPLVKWKYQQPFQRSDFFVHSIDHRPTLLPMDLEDDIPENGKSPSVSQPCVTEIQQGSYLRSEEGYALAVRRMTEPKSVFGQLKNNRGFRRFLLRGLSKVTLKSGCFRLPITC